MRHSADIAAWLYRRRVLREAEEEQEQEQEQEN